MGAIKGHICHSWGKFPLIMGVVNVTPDSFSDGGEYFSAKDAIAHGKRLIEDGADILDVGGESTRPGAVNVGVAEEIRRVVPVIEGLRNCGRWISVDTRNAETMHAAIEAGAHIVNDISGLTHDAESMDVIRRKNTPVILMHMQKTPGDMQKNPIYNNVVEDVFQWLESRIQACRTHRIEAEMLIADPGIGFGKSVEHNLLLLRNIKKFHDLGVPLLLGTSRKSFIGKLCGDAPPEHRIGGSLSSVLWGLAQGVQIFRVHDVRETKQAFEIYNAILAASQE